MATIRDIIERAYRKIAVVSEDEPMTGAQSQNGLAAYNDMMFGFKARGINVLHVEAAMTDDFPHDAALIEPVVYVLAARLAHDNLVAAPPVREHENAIAAWFENTPTATMPSVLRRRRRYGMWGVV